MLEDSKYVRCLLIDFSKAFDSVDHLVLINKLIKFNIADNIIKWIVSFSTDRDQYTKLGDQRSFTRVINRSIVQGSGIGPTLFVIFICDFRPISVYNRMARYSDATTLLVPEKTDVQLQDEFNSVTNWASVNKLSMCVQD